MANDCPDLDHLERFLEGEFKSGKESDSWASHLEICEECRDLLYGHQQLVENLAELPVPRLSPFFNQKLRAGLEKQRTHVASARLRRFLLQGYWLLALALSFLILDSLAGPVHVPAVLSFTLAIPFILAVAVMGFVMSRFNLGVSDFILHTAVDPKL
jgi:predicted anti-sigma-YlaC factor YlaD